MICHNVSLAECLAVGGNCAQDGNAVRQSYLETASDAGRNKDDYQVELLLFILC